MTMKNKTLTTETQLVHDERHAEGAIAPPIYQSSLFAFRDYQAMVDRYQGDAHQAVYSRIDNPTNNVLHDKIATLERGGEAVAFASGMAAISNTILSIVDPGDRIVCVNHVYPDTYRFLRGFCARFNVVTDFVDGTDPAEIEARLPGAKLLYLESPNSWMMQEQNLEAAASLAKKHGVTTIADNSWASPINQKPLDLGIDLVVHSASKYISGHSDTVAGVVVGSAEMVEQINRDVRPYLGASLSAGDAARLIRGLRTLPLRMRRHHDTGLQIAERLAEHADVMQVCHPGLHKKDFSHLSGYGGLFSFEMGEAVDIPKFCDALEIFRLGVSWGGYESLIVPAGVAHNQAGQHNAAVDFKVPPRMIRLFTGLEDPGDLWNDLASAFKAAGRDRSD